MSRIFLSFSLLLLTTCAREGPGPPPVDMDRLAPAVADVQLAEALVAEMPFVMRDSMKVVYYVETLREHGMDSTTFDSLMWIVRSEAEWMDSLFTRTGDILARYEAELVKDR